MHKACIQLAEERQGVIQPQRGTFVVKISVEDVLDACFVREAIKVAIVADLAALAAPAAIRMLREILRQQRQFRHGHNAEFLAFDEQFQRALVLSAGGYAWRTIENIKAQMDRTRYLSLDNATPIPLLIKRTSGLSMRSNRAIRTRHPPPSARTCSKSYNRCQKLPGNSWICLNRAEQPDGAG